MLRIAPGALKMTTRIYQRRTPFCCALLAISIGPLLLVSCRTTTEQVRIAYFTRFQKAEAGHTPQEEAILKRLCLFGEPQHASGWPHGPTEEIVREGYVLEHSLADKIPLWVCEHLGNEDLGGSLKRPDPEPFKPDPKLPPGSRAELKDYKHSSYDRGHQAPSGDETKNQSRQDATYFLSNMVPQIGQALFGARHGHSLVHVCREINRFALLERGAIGTAKDMIATDEVARCALRGNKPDRSGAIRLRIDDSHAALNPGHN